MDTTKTLLERLRARLGGATNYRLAKHLSIANSAAARYAKGGGGMSFEIGMRVADELELPRDYVLLCLAAEREQSEAIKPMWRELAAKASGQTARPATTRRRTAKVAAVLLGAGITAFCSLTPPPASASERAGSVYYG